MAADVPGRPDLAKQLEAGVARLTTSAEWEHFMSVWSRFHTYSASNALLIVRQCPTASRVASYRAWKAMGRYVRHGEHALWVLAPMTVSRARIRASSTDVLPDVGSTSLDGHERDVNTEGHPSVEGATGDRWIRGFRYVPVFDIAQTDGDELPVVCHPLVGEAPAHVFEGLTAVAQMRGFDVEISKMEGTAHGDCSHLAHLIRVREGNAPLQQVKTLAHELAHALLHRDAIQRDQAEIEAESVAYLVCQQVGIHSGEYTFGYLAGWGGGAALTLATLRSSWSAIHEAAEAILSELEGVTGLLPSGAAHDARAVELAGQQMPLSRHDGVVRPRDNTPIAMKTGTS